MRVSSHKFVLLNDIINLSENETQKPDKIFLKCMKSGVLNV